MADPKRAVDPVARLAEGACECPIGAAYQVHCPHHGIPAGSGFDGSWSASAHFVARLLLHLLLGGKLRVWYITRGRRYAALFEPLP